MKKVFLIMLVIIIASVSIEAFAEALFDTPPASQISSNLDYASTTWSSSTQKDIEDSNFAIIFVNDSISKSSSTSVSVFSLTQTNATAGAIIVELCVQRWYNNKWENYSTTDLQAIGTDSCSGSLTISVQSGYYYRLAASHLASQLGQISTVHTYTKSVFVN